MTRPRICTLFFGIAVLCSSAHAHALASDSQDSDSSNVLQQSPDDQRGIFNDYNISNVKIRTHDALLLDARAYEPKVSAFPGRRPAIIFTNSWTLGEYEYETQARRFASRGYIVLSYSSRGFGGSEGAVTVGGPNDVQDFSTIVDWLEDNTRVDVANIGMAGVSLGGGMALLALGSEPRIKTAASLSGWGNLEQSIYRNNTIQRTWLDILIGSGKLTGHLDPDIFEQLDHMEKRTDVVATRAWAAARSPESYLDQINARKAPVFMENSYLDALFPPLQIRNFYERLEGEKRMLTDEGLHASAAIPGILGLPSNLWNEVHDWMDHYLIDESIPIKTGLSFKIDNETNYFQNYPALNYSALKFTALNSLESDYETGRSVIFFQGNKDSGATTGIPFISDGLNVYVNVPVKKKISDIDTRFAAVLKSQVLHEDLKVRGSARVSFTLLPHESPVTLVAYLYDLDAWGTGVLESFSVTSYQDPSAVATEVKIDLNVSGYEIPKGHRVAVAIDTVDALYTPATGRDYFVSIAAEPALSVELPVIQ
ncbi:MAG: alpha/beta hydrolase [Oligoflexus sp.]|nr:alpha/beta hydrolase [Oligoflexus sp.]